MPILRTLSGLVIAAACLAGCGSVTGGSASPATTPQFVDPATRSAEASPATVPTPTTAAPSPSVKPTPSRSQDESKTESVRYVFPVDASNVDWHNTHSKYPGTDLFVDCGSRFVATTSGKVLEVSLRDRYVKGNPDGPFNGGLSVAILGDDGVRYYGSHLSKVQSGIEPGARVKAGQLLGLTGRTGNASNVCHVHYGISPPCAETGDWKVRRGVVWPYSYLASWRKDGQKSPVAAVTAWERKNNCKA
ncbi:M23 family metallopeptidase [Actinoplanes sp. G11-F43]|uniref:M23 family metallopeptidase n=1 Tax=Actinoplanes sp. G11-F43 TaxID=3424130 RepID=UPI003D346B88